MNRMYAFVRTYTHNSIYIYIYIYYIYIYIIYIYIISIYIYIYIYETSLVTRHCTGEKARAYDSLHYTVKFLWVGQRQSVQWTFNLDHVTMVETCVALLTIVCSYCSF